jgi:predicted transcriptional regulator
MNERKIVRTGDIMNSKFILVDGLSTVADALAQLKKEKARIVVVTKRHEDDEFGIVLLSDIAKKIIAKDRSPARVNVYEIMSKPVIGVRPTMDIRYTARLFENFGIAAAPVLHSGEVLGIVTYEDMALRALEIGAD